MLFLSFKNAFKLDPFKIVLFGVRGYDGAVTTSFPEKCHSQKIIIKGRRGGGGLKAFAKLIDKINVGAVPLQGDQGRNFALVVNFQHVKGQVFHDSVSFLLAKKIS